MSVNTYIRLGLGILMVCMCLQATLFCDYKVTTGQTGQGYTVRAIQADLEASEINDAA